jgi:diadenosine tetraphosphatase ApaH/serine/threonine PP2A family protein phosphatase
MIIRVFVILDHFATGDAHQLPPQLGTLDSKLVELRIRYFAHRGAFHRLGIAAMYIIRHGVETDDLAWQMETKDLLFASIRG